MCHLALSIAGAQGRPWGALRLLEFVTTVAQQVLLILVQSHILISISRDLFYFIVLYSLILFLGEL